MANKAEQAAFRLESYNHASWIKNLGFENPNNLCHELEILTARVMLNGASSKSDDNQLHQNTSVSKTDEIFNVHYKLRDDDEKFKDAFVSRYRNHLHVRHSALVSLCDQVTKTINALDKLTDECNKATEKTDELDGTSRCILTTQESLITVNDCLSHIFEKFSRADTIGERLSSGTVDVVHENFFELLTNIDDGVDFMKSHPNYVESARYVSRYESRRASALILARLEIFEALRRARTAATLPSVDHDHDSGPHLAISYYYGKFRASMNKIRPILIALEKRSMRAVEYQRLLEDVIDQYVRIRYDLLSDGVLASLRQLGLGLGDDRTASFRSACSLFVRLCLDEHVLYRTYFGLETPLEKLREFLERLCALLYDELRPCVIHIEHCEILCEIYTILRYESADQIAANREALEPFGTTLDQLAKDVVERLVFRAHIYFQTDVLDYKPSSGDLAYPDCLCVATGFSMISKSSYRVESPGSVGSGSEISSTTQGLGRVSKLRMDIETYTDPHGMWYPPVRRTLQCLSKLYRCVDAETFRTLSQEALHFCVDSIDHAAELITVKVGSVHAELFRIKHLLILREQTAPFQVDFTSRETTLDFSGTKAAASELVRGDVFSFGSRNAIIRFVLEGAPRVIEQHRDSRKYVDSKLKNACESLIAHAIEYIVGPVSRFVKLGLELTHDRASVEAINAAKQTWAEPHELSTAVRSVVRNLKSLVTIEEDIRLYVHNRDTEAVLMRPIKNGVIATFVQLEQLQSDLGYTEEQKQFINAPSADHVSVMLSSMALLESTETAICQSNN